MFKTVLRSTAKIIKRHSYFHRKPKLSELIPAIVIHGGISHDFTMHAPFKMTSMIAAVNRGYSVLKASDNVIDAVEATMVYMEDNVDFNTGFGSMLNEAGQVEMDSCIMCGDDLRTGAVGCISDIQNPVRVARAVMEKSPHVLFCCEGAKEFAIKQKFDVLKPGALVTERSKFILKERVGADIGNAGVVAINSKGQLAAATGSGGPVGRLQGRCGECCRVGCGIYAIDSVAGISTAGDGDSILKSLLAYATIKDVQLGLHLAESIDKHIRKVHSMFGKPAGAIGISKSGEVAIHFTSPMMPWAYRSPSEFIYGHTIKEVPPKYRSHFLD